MWVWWVGRWIDSVKYDGYGGWNSGWVVGWVNRQC